MKIENSLKPTGTPTGDRVKPRAATAGSGTANAADDVRLSALSAQLQAADDEAPIDSARVQEIKSAIAEGRFAINAGAIADRLISSAQELIDSQRQA